MSHWLSGEVLVVFVSSITVRAVAATVMKLPNTLCLKKWHPFYFFCNNFAKLASILVMFGRCIAMDMCNKRGIITTV